MWQSRTLSLLLGLVVFQLLSSPFASAQNPHPLAERHWEKNTYQIRVLDTDNVWHEGLFVFVDTAGLVMLDGQKALWGIDTLHFLYLHPNQITRIETKPGLTQIGTLLTFQGLAFAASYLTLASLESSLNKIPASILLGVAIGSPLGGLYILLNHEKAYPIKPFAVAGQPYGANVLIAQLHRANLIEQRAWLSNDDFAGYGLNTIEEAYQHYRDYIPKLEDIYEPAPLHVEAFIARRYGPGYRNINRRWLDGTSVPPHWRMRGLKLNYGVNEHISVSLQKERGGIRNRGTQEYISDTATNYTSTWNHRSYISATYAGLEFRQNLLPNQLANLYLGGGLNLGVERFYTETRIREQTSNRSLFFGNETIRDEKLEVYQRRFFAIRPTAQVQFEAIHWLFTLGATATKLPDIIYQALTIDLPVRSRNYHQQTFSLDYWQMHFGVGYRF